MQFRGTLSSTVMPGVYHGCRCQQNEQKFFQLTNSSGLRHHLRFRLDLDPPPRIEQSLHDHHRRRRIGIAKHLAVRAADSIPVPGIDNEHPRTHNILTGAAEGFDRFQDDLETAFRLNVGVADDGLSVCVERSRSGNNDSRTTSDRTREADEALVRRGRSKTTIRDLWVFRAHVGALYTRSTAGQDPSKREPIRAPLKRESADTTGCGRGSSRSPSRARPVPRLLRCSLKNRIRRTFLSAPRTRNHFRATHGPSQP